MTDAFIKNARLSAGLTYIAVFSCMSSIAIEKQLSIGCLFDEEEFEMPQYLFRASRLEALHEYDQGRYEMQLREFEAADDYAAQREVNTILSHGKWSEFPPHKLFRVEEVPLEPTTDVKRRAFDREIGKEIDEHPIGAARQLRP